MVDPAHFEALWKRTPVENVVPISQPLAALMIHGESYRLKQKRKTGLLGKSEKQAN